MRGRWTSVQLVPMGAGAMQLLPSSFPASSLRQICPSGDSPGLQRETGRHMSCGAVATAHGGVVRRVNDATISLGAYRVLTEAPQDRCCIFSGLRQLVRSETGFYHQEEIIKTHLSLSCLSKKLLNQNHDAAGGMQEGGWRKCLWMHSLGEAEHFRFSVDSWFFTSCHWPCRFLCHRIKGFPLSLKWNPWVPI